MYSLMISLRICGLKKVVTSRTRRKRYVTHGGTARKILKKIIDFSTQSNWLSNFSDTTVELAEKFYNPFSHLFIFDNIFAQVHGFDHRVDSCYREFIRSKNYALNNLWWNCAKVIMKADKVIPENLVAVC